MKEIYPGFYQTFVCIANRCEDSCCKDWDIDIDSQTEKFYQTVQGALGDKIRSKLVTDEYDERVFRAEHGRCPFWNRDMLCDIFIGIGEEHLSDTCGNFPRVSVEYGKLREHLLSFACPEAARLMLKAGANAYESFGGADELSDVGDEADFLSFLLKARKRSAAILQDKTQPFGYRLSDCLDFNAQVQNLLDGEEPTPLSFDGVSPDGDGFIFDLHRGFEIMSDKWRAALEEAAAQTADLVIRPDFDSDFEAFALYYLHRYYLEAVRSGDVLYSLQRIACAYLVTGRLDALFARQGYPYPRLRILQRYSKEVEHSYVNTVAMNNAFESDERFSVENLMTLLEQTVPQ